MKQTFTVGISRDPALISYCQPDLIITSNCVPINENIPIIALSDLMPDKPFLKIYDTDILEIIDKNNKIREQVFSEIDKQANNRQVVINPYYNAFTEKFRKKGYTVIGPSDELAYEFSRKTVAYKFAEKNNVPVPEGKILKNINEVKEYWMQNSFASIFVASDDDPYHPTNIHAKNKADLKTLPQNIPYLVTKWIKSANSYNTQVLIGPNSIFYLGLTDQIIKKDVKYYGNRYPTTTSSENQATLKKYSLALSKALQKKGYRGIVGFDWIKTKDNALLFVETNPRKNRSSAMLINFINHYRPNNSPSIIDLEIQASQNEDWHTHEWPVPNDIYWIMEVQKSYKDIISKKNIKPKYSANNIFSTTRRTRTSILNFPKKGTVIQSSCPDIARIISVGKDKNNIQNKLSKAKEKLAKALKTV